MKLSELLEGLINNSQADFEISGVELDSRHINNGDVFIASKGANYHGLAYVDQAIANGAKAIIYDPETVNFDYQPVAGVLHIALTGLEKNLGAIAAKFYGFPSQKLEVIGVTGTNGKTSCSQFIAQSLSNCGVIGTLGWGEPGKMTPTVNTTPDVLTNQKILNQFVRQKKSAVAMEVSSHGLQQGRVAGIDFKGAVFTNLTHDHLDFHGDMKAYLQAKLSLFTNPKLQFAVVNLDDLNAQVVLGGISANVQCWTFSSRGRSQAGAESIIASQINLGLEGIHFKVTWRGETLNAFSTLVGSFNLENLLAVLAVLLGMSIPFKDAVARLSQLKAIPGRMEQFGGKNKPTVFVDYAHTPDALEKVLMALNGKGRLSVVFGCGGNRDKSKRKAMGKIAETFADQVIITDDNPRNEPAINIIRDILAGCSSNKVSVINDRSLAIRSAIEQASHLDCIVVAGKGHENYQEINGVRIPFSDQEIINHSLAAWSQQK